MEVHMWILILQGVTLLLVLMLLWDHMAIRHLISDAKKGIVTLIEKKMKPAPPPPPPSNHGMEIDEFTTDSLEDISKMEML